MKIILEAEAAELAALIEALRGQPAETLENYKPMGRIELDAKKLIQDPPTGLGATDDRASGSSCRNCKKF